MENPEFLAVLALVGTVVWLSPWRDKSLASFTTPKTLEELQKDVDSPRLGTQVHHIVPTQYESSHELANYKIFGDRLEASDTKVRIPYWSHWAISRWYSTPNAAEPYLGKNPREWLRGKSWEQQYRVGLDALRDVGVLQ